MKKKEIISFDKGWAVADPLINNFLQRVEDLDPDGGSQNPKVPMEEYNNVYHVIFEMCNQKDPYNLSGKLWKAYEDKLRTYFKTKTKAHLERANKDSMGDGKAILKAWSWRWQTATWVIFGMKRYFTFLDRYYVKSQDHLQSLLRTGYKIYHKHIFEQFKEHIPGVLLKLITEEREGVEIDRGQVQKAIESFVEIGNMITPENRGQDEKLRVYRELFEDKFIKETRQYYIQKTREWLTQSTPEYLKIAEKRLKSEQDRRVSYIHKSTDTKLNDVITQQLLMEHQTELLNKPTGLRKMFDNMQGMTRRQAEEDLARLYQLYLNRLDAGIEPISKIMRDYISKAGQAFVTQAKMNDDKKGDAQERQKALIINLLNLHGLFLGILQNQFGNHHACDRALREGFKDFINQEEYVAIRLAQYSHQVLKKGGERGQLTINEILDNITKLYDYINDKDYFENNYQRFLAERLINDLSDAFDHEKSMIAKLKTVGGNAAWSKKLEEMFKDLATSLDTMQEFKNYCIKNPIDAEFDVDFECRVCTYGQWPSTSFDIIPMPKMIKPITDAFKHFYEEKFSGRTLEYRMDQGKAEVVVPFKKGMKTFVVSPFQMSILLAFNEKPMWEHVELQEHTGIPEKQEDFERALLSLAHPKLKLLQKKPMTKTCKPGDMYRVNMAFKHARARIVVPPFKQSISKQKAQTEQEKRAIMKLREHQIDASVVRIMKTRKSAKHNDLIAEVIRQLTQRFSPKPAFIKKRIAILIDQDYLKRDDHDRTKYHYIS